MKWHRSLPVDAVLVLMIVGFAATGIVVVFSATAPGSGVKYLIRQSAYAGLGGILCALFSYMSPDSLRRLALWGFLAAIGLMLLTFTPLGIVRNGAARWVQPGFQPSEFAKLALILMLARCLAGARDWPKRQLDTYIACMTLTLGVCALCLLQRDLGSAILVFCFGMITLYFAGLNVYAVTGTVVTAATAALAFARMEEYRWERITAFLDPTRDPVDVGYQVCRMLCTVARGGLIGEGVGLSREKWLGIPAIEADAVYCVVAAELGFIGAAALVVAFFFFIRRAVVLARSQPDFFSSVLMASLGSAIALQAFINMGVATGCVPCTGLTLPFISHGGSSLLTTLAAAGIMLSLSRQSLPEPESEGDT
jgi:cell division protein FtsW